MFSRFEYINDAIGPGISYVDGRADHQVEPFISMADANASITNYIGATGQMVNESHNRFSTKYLDEETGSYYYGHRYYCANLSRWISRDPMGELGFELSSLRPLSNHEKLIRDLRIILNEVQRRAPEIVQMLKSLLNDVGIDLCSMQEEASLYSFVENQSITKIDLFGLLAGGGSEAPPKKEPPKDDKQCCDKDAAKGLLDEAVSGLLEQAKALPGKAGEIAKIVDMLKKIKDTGDSCSAMSDVAATCAEFGKDLTSEKCYACCMGIYGSFGNLFGGVGHLKCTGICSKFN